MLSTRQSALLVAICGVGVCAGISSGQNLQDRINHVMQKKAAAQSQNHSKGEMLGSLLYTDISVQFQDSPARDAIKHIETVLGINIVGRYSDDRTGTGLDPAAPVTLNVTNKPALTVLEMILDQAAGDEEATWQLREGYVEVGTKERLAGGSAREIRYYPIKDLLFNPPQFNNAPELDLNNALNQSQNQQGGGGGGGGAGGGSGGGGNQGNIFSNTQPDDPRPTEAELAEQIMDLIMETVEPDGWEINGGTWSTIRYYQGTLIIRAPDFIHRQIGGYPFALRPVRVTAQAPGPRYVMFTGGVSNVELVGIETQRFTGAAGGSNFGGGGGGGGGGGTGGSAPAPTGGNSGPAGGKP